MKQPVPLLGPALPSLVTAANESVRTCFVEFFATDIRNVHTRRAYTLGINEFLVWCKRNGVAALKDIQPVHVSGCFGSRPTAHCYPGEDAHTVARPSAPAA